MEPNAVVLQNRRAWDEVASRHAELNFERTRELLSRNEAAFLDTTFKEYLRNLGIEGKIVAQFNCNNGRELISAVQLGAQRGIGFDFSAEFLDQARSYQAVTGANVEFVETDIYALSGHHSEIADIMILTSGALCWMPDLHGYFEKAKQVLRPSGSLVIYETHPFVEMFKLDRERDAEEPVQPYYSYFMPEPVRSENGLDYYSNTKYGKEIVFWYHHTISHVIQSAIDCGLRLRSFSEFAHDTDSGYASLRKLSVQLPMSYLLHLEMP